MKEILKRLFGRREEMDEKGERKRKLKWYAKRVAKKYEKTFRKLAHE